MDVLRPYMDNAALTSCLMHVCTTRRGMHLRHLQPWPCLECVPATPAAMAAQSSKYYAAHVAHVALCIMLPSAAAVITAQCSMHYIALEGVPATAAAMAAQSSMYQSELLDFIYELFERFLEPMLAFLRANCSEAIPSSDINLVTSVAQIFTVCVFCVSDYVLKRVLRNDEVSINFPMNSKTPLRKGVLCWLYAPSSFQMVVVMTTYLTLVGGVHISRWSSKGLVTSWRQMLLMMLWDASCTDYGDGMCYACFSHHGTYSKRLTTNLSCIMDCIQALTYPSLGIGQLTKHQAST
eukprot:1160026-Pelagomonas_calceolata.AAC.20